MDLLTHLTLLSASDLSAVLMNRPEAAALHGRKRASMPELAATLESEFGIQAAAGRLDRFHHQLLQLACVFDGRLDRETAAAQGVPMDAFDPAVRKLSRRALAFPSRGGMDVPPEVQVVIPLHFLGAPLRPLLQAENVERLKRMANAVGASPGRKAALVDAIYSRLSDPSCVRTLLRDAPTKSLRALEVIRKAGGEAPFFSLVAELGPSVHRLQYGYSFGTEATDETGFAWLWSRGLVFKTSDWAAGLVLVPAPVEVALRGRAFEAWEAAAPELELSPVAYDRTPLTLVEEASRLVQTLTTAEMPLLKSGEIGVRECRRLAAELGSDEPSLRRLLVVALRAGLLRVKTESRPTRRRGGRWDPPDETHAVVATDEGGRWLTSDPAKAWLSLFKAWLALMKTEASLTAAASSSLLGLVLETLLEVPPDQAVTVSSFGRRLGWMRPAIWADDEAAIADVTEVQSVLHAMGVSPASGAVAVSDVGRVALDGGGAAAIRPLLPSGVETCTVQSDMTVIVAGPPSVALGGGLSRFADLLSSGAARIYRLSEQSVRRGLDQGMTATEIESFLSARSQGELPGPVRELVRDLGRRHGRLRVGTAAVYIAAEDATVVAEAMASGKVRSLKARLVTPTVAVVEGKTQAQVVEALRSAGLMPRVEAAPREEEPLGPPAKEPAQSRPLTKAEQLEKRREALARARAARAEKLRQLRQA